MNPTDLILAVLLMGLPMGGLSWLIFTWLYSSGEIDRSADRRTVTARVKEMKASYKSSSANRRSNPILAKWMWFGSGFYGLAGLWTFVVIEITPFFSFLFNYPGIDYPLRDGAWKNAGRFFRQSASCFQKGNYPIALWGAPGRIFPI